MGEYRMDAGFSRGQVNSSCSPLGLVGPPSPGIAEGFAHSHQGASIGIPINENGNGTRVEPVSDWRSGQPAIKRKGSRPSMGRRCGISLGHPWAAVKREPFGGIGSGAHESLPPR